MDNYTVYMHVSPGGKKYIGITGQSIESGDIRNISACCLGKKKTAYGYVWLYESEVV